MFQQREASLRQEEAKFRALGYMRHTPNVSIFFLFMKEQLPSYCE